MLMNLEHGLNALKMRLEDGDPDVYLRFMTFESRLLENIQEERDFGIGESLRNDRARIMRELNRLALTHCKVSFNDLCGRDISPTVAKQEQTSEPALPAQPPKIKFKTQLSRLINLEFEGRAFESPMGEIRSTSRLPYSADELIAVLKALRTKKYDESRFNPAQREALKRLGLLSHSHFVPNLLAEVGQALYNQLMADQMQTAFLMALNQARTAASTVALQLRFDEQATELARYPWELLYYRRHLLPSQAVELTRYISYPEAPTPLAVSLPLRLLYITARPTNLTSLPLASERDTALQALQPMVQKGHLHLDELSEPTYDALLDYLDDHTPHILHFDGHGRFARHCARCDTGNYPHLVTCGACGTSLFGAPQGYLAFEKGAIDRSVHWVSSDTLGHLFGPTLRLAMLSACDSGTVRGETLFGGVAPSLIQAGVPAVVATQLPISPQAATAFAKGFYRALARFQSLPTAVNAGRRRLFSTKEWFIPVLYLRSLDEEGQLFVKP